MSRRSLRSPEGIARGHQPVGLGKAPPRPRATGLGRVPQQVHARHSQHRKHQPRLRSRDREPHGRGYARIGEPRPGRTETSTAPDSAPGRSSPPSTSKLCTRGRYAARLQWRHGPDRGLRPRCVRSGGGRRRHGPSASAISRAWVAFSAEASTATSRTRNTEASRASAGPAAAIATRRGASPTATAIAGTPGLLPRRVGHAIENGHRLLILILR